MSPEPLKAMQEQSFEYDRPTPDTCLLQIEKVEFKKNEEGNTVFGGYAKIIESVKHPDNVDMGMPLFFELALHNGKPFKIQKFMGLLQAVKGEEVTIPPPYDQFFNNVRVQADVQQRLPNAIVGAIIQEKDSYWSKKKNKQINDDVEFKTFLTKAEYMELKNKVGVSGLAAPGDVPASTPQAESPGVSKGFF